MTVLLWFDLHIKGAFTVGLITILTLFKDTLSCPLSMIELLGGEHYENPFKYNSPLPLKPLLPNQSLFSQSSQHLLVINWA